MYIIDMKDMEPTNDSDDRRSKMKKIMAWHFTSGWNLRDGQPLEAGKTYTHSGDHIQMCKTGLHGSQSLLDALSYAPGNVVSRVEMVTDENTLWDDDKLCCHERRVLWAVDIAQVLRVFACDCTERALRHERETGREPDKRSWRTARVMRQWVEGKKGRATARAAARASGAAGAAARAAEAARAAAGAARTAEWEWQRNRLAELIEQARNA